MQSKEKSDAEKLGAINAVAADLAALVSQNKVSVSSPQWPQLDLGDVSNLPTPQDCPALVEYPESVLPDMDKPCKFRDKKTYAEWKLRVQQNKLNEYARAALSGGYVAGAVSQGASAPPPSSFTPTIRPSNDAFVAPDAPPASFSTPPASSDPGAAFGAATLSLLADLDDGPPDVPDEDYDDYYGEEEGYAGYGDDDDEAPPPPPDDDYDDYYETDGPPPPPPPFD